MSAGLSRSWLAWAGPGLWLLKEYQRIAHTLCRRGLAATADGYREVSLRRESKAPLTRKNLPFLVVMMHFFCSSAGIE